MMDFRRTSLTLVVLASVILGVAPAVAGVPVSRAARPASVTRPTHVTALDNQRRVDVNNLNMFVTNFGSWGYDLSTGNAGLVYPKGTEKTAVFAAGLWFGATVNGQTRVEVGEYSQEYGPGIIKPDGTWDDVANPDYRVYKVVRWTGDPQDTAHVDRPAEALAADPVADPLVHHSWSEYMKGAVPYGAPWKTYQLPDPNNPDATVAVPGPDVLGDQMLWSVYNDADPALHTNEAGNSAPLGLEIRQTTFSFNRLGALGNTIFLKFQIIHPAVYTETIDQMYVSLWSDPDLGGSTDDLVGCDVPLSLGYVYNANNNDQLYGKAPPTVGFDFFLGPTGPTGDTLGMTSFNKYINGTDPSDPEQTYNYMQGLQADGNPLVDPSTGLVTTYFNSGDPVTGQGWLDNNAADKRLMLSSGPFRMAPGDTQVVVAAMIVGQGKNRLSSISGLRFFDVFAQDAFDKNFILPNPPPTPKVQVTQDHGSVTLCWDVASRNNYDEPGYKFEGYNVYQGATVAGPWELLATYDEVNQVRVVYDEVFDLETGQLIPQFPTAFGSDAGVNFCHTVTQDAIRGGNLRDGTDYFFAVTAYAYFAEGRPKVLESAQTAIRATPQRPPAGTDFGTASAADVQYFQWDPTKPPSTDVITVDVVTPSLVTGHTYLIKFDELVPPFSGQVGLDTATVRYGWSLIDSTTGEVKLADQINQRNDDDYQIVDGLRVRVNGAYFPALQTVSHVNANTAHLRAITGVNWSGNQDWFFGGAGPGIDFFGDGSLDPATQPDSFTTVKLLFTEPRQGQQAYRYLRLELGDSSAAGDVGDPPPQGRGYVYGGYYHVNFWAIDEVNGDTLDAAWVERMKTDATGSYLPDARQFAFEDSLWTPDPLDDSAREYLFILKRKYSVTDTLPKPFYTTPGVPSALRSGEMPELYALWAALRGDVDGDGVDEVIDPGDYLRFTWAVPATPNDYYVFDTSKLLRNNVALAKGNLDRIRAVPNPYYNRSTYELSQFNRVVRFVNMPEQATVRLFNLQGQLVRTLHKTDATSSILNWDLQTENDLPVASGVYIYHVDVPGVGTTYGRLVVFMEKERLNNF